MLYVIYYILYIIYYILYIIYYILYIIYYISYIIYHVSYIIYHIILCYIMLYYIILYYIILYYIIIILYYIIYTHIYIGVSTNGGTPNGWFISRKIQQKNGWWLEVPLFSEEIPILTYSTCIPRFARSVSRSSRGSRRKRWSLAVRW